MTSADFFYAVNDGLYWVYENTLEPTGEIFWKTVMFGGFIGFIYWMYRQAKYNKIAKNTPGQIK